MKKSINIILTILITITMGTTNSFADKKKLNKSETNVENASHEEWESLAIKSEKILKKNQSIYAAKELLEQSIEAHACSFNLELMGDYYYKVDSQKNALAHYLKSLNMLKVNDINANVSGIQSKIKASRDKNISYDQTITQYLVEIESLAENGKHADVKRVQSKIKASRNKKYSVIK